MFIAVTVTQTFTLPLVGRAGVRVTPAYEVKEEFFAIANV
jgi:hypothetical protein